MTSFRNLVAAALIGVAALPVSAHSISEGDITVTHPWTRPTPPAVSIGVGYMAISNNGKTEVTFTGGKTPKAKAVSIHQSSMKNDMMTMKPVPDGLPIPAGETVLLEPSGYHLMLEGLTGAITSGETVPMTLTFDGAGPVEVELQTMDMDPTEHKH
ncbi:copper chaperone PCu(A)C [Marinobacter halotolerans]|uniref:copper chaperone PCu(A)C n=1 Tax=Marinobacter halotolerans TaxID=1569211 RepID=UPI0012490EA4|nr:copper chaperone PCu(A)C [Marinobacter halotolerans]